MKAVTIGSATLDIIATVADPDIERMTLHNSTSSFLLLEPGRKVDASSVATQVGGGAVNAAVSLARQGFDVAALIKTGSDHNAEKVLSRLREQGVDTGLVRTSEDQATAVSVMIASHDRNAAIFTHRGANGFLEPGDIPGNAFEDTGLVYITNLSNASADCFPGIVRDARGAGAFVAVNPGIRQLTRKTGPFFDSLENIDFFTCNEEEARALVPQLVDRTGWKPKSANNIDQDTPTLAIEGFQLSFADYFDRLHKLGPRFVIITLGAQGAFVSDRGQVHFQPALPTRVAGTVGAGDAFASTLAGGLVQGRKVADASLRAARNAASVIGYIDAQEGLLNAGELDAG